MTDHLNLGSIYYLGIAYFYVVSSKAKGTQI